MNVSQAMPQTTIRPVTRTSSVAVAQTASKASASSSNPSLAGVLDRMMGPSSVRDWLRDGATPLEVCYAAGKMGWASNAYNESDLIAAKRALANGEKVLALLPTGWFELKSVDSNLLGMINSVTVVDPATGSSRKVDSASFTGAWGSSIGPGYRNYFLTLRQGGNACPQISGNSVAFGEAWRSGFGLLETGMAHGHSKQALAGLGLMGIGLLASPIGLIGSGLKWLGNLITGGNTTSEKLARGGIGASIAALGNGINAFVGNFVAEGGNILLSVTY